MSGDLLALAAVLVAPALMILGLLAVVGLILIGLADADAADGRLFRPRPSEPASSSGDA